LLLQDEKTATEIRI